MGFHEQSGGLQPPENFADHATYTILLLLIAILYASLYRQYNWPGAMVPRVVLFF